MSGAFSIGPLLLPFSLLVVLASVFAALSIGKRLGRRAGVDAEGVLWQALLLGALVARLAFVVAFGSVYRESALAIVDLRDGGWNAPAGFAAAWLYAGFRFWRAPALRRPLVASLLAATILFVAGNSFVSARAGGERRLPDLVLESLDGGAVRLDAFVGRPVVVNLWATWCPPCVREMPVLRDAQRERPDVHFVFVDQGESRQQVANWLRARNLSLDNVLLDPQRNATAVFRQNGYPVTLFFDADGKLVDTRIGALSAATLQARLVRLTR